MNTLSCFKCGKPLDSVFKDRFGSTVMPPGCEHLNQPNNAMCFGSSGHYGSTLFDSMDGSSLEINICDPCIQDAKGSGLILYYPPKPIALKSVPVLWNGE